MKQIRKTYSNMDSDVNFQEIDRQLLVGFECNQFDNDKKKFLSMIREQTTSAFDNKKYWNAI